LFRESFTINFESKENVGTGILTEEEKGRKKKKSNKRMALWCEDGLSYRHQTQCSWTHRLGSWVFHYRWRFVGLPETSAYHFYTPSATFSGYWKFRFVHFLLRK
jgi:hypothetical protein